MFSGWLSPVTPVHDEPPVRLLDLSLIVVGEGAVAEDLVRRRRLAGGRVCWLETRRQPQSFVLLEQPTLDGLKPTNSRWATCTGRCHEILDTEVSWDLSSFLWKPPSWRQRSWHVKTEGVKRSTRQWGTARYAWRTSGPEIVQLRDEEAYNVILGDEESAPGVQVVGAKQEEDDEASLRWELSGVVVFAGGDFASLKGKALVCNSPTAAAKLDVSVGCEDAKPFVTVRPLHVLGWALLCLVQFFVYFLLMGLFEPNLKPGEIPWWRASFAVLSIAPFGFAATAEVLGPALTGAFVGWRLAAVMSFHCTLGQFLACVVPIGWIGGRFYTWPLYVSQCLAFMWYLFFTLPLHVLSVRRQRPREADGRKIRWRAHIGWFLWLLSGTFGTWVMYYVVAVVYIMMASGTRFVASAVALPLMTCAVELFTVIATIRLYDYFILSGRLKNWGFTILGDQKTTVIFPICMTHSYAESTRLVSMLVSTVKSPGFGWLAPLLIGFAMNITLRTSNSTKLLGRIVPSRCLWLILPDAGTVLHNEARLCFGYPRFVSLLALGLTNMVLHGFTKWPLFNLHGTTLVAAAAFLEMLEDLIVTSGVLQSDSWKAELAPLYRRMNPLQPSQVMGFDRDGVQPSGPAIGFSGMRFLQFRTVVVAMAPACFFAYNLLALLLGAGYVHGTCETWINMEHTFIDGLVWWSPLRC